MSAGHTPGPWKACKDAKCPCGAIWDASGEIHLATAFDASALGMECFGSDVGVSREERISNARLIAASPCLFDAAQIAKYAIAQCLLDPSPLNQEGLRLALKKLDAAIQKATGATS